MQDPVLFTLTVLLILGTPGPTNTLLATAGATVGFRRALPLLPAEAAGYLIAILAIGLALGPFIAGVALAWIGLGSLLGRAAGAAGRAGLVPKLGAAAVAAFALVLVVGPLLR